MRFRVAGARSRRAALVGPAAALVVRRAGRKVRRQVHAHPLARAAPLRAAARSADPAGRRLRPHRPGGRLSTFAHGGPRVVRALPLAVVGLPGMPLRAGIPLADEGARVVACGAGAGLALPRASEARRRWRRPRRDGPRDRLHLRSPARPPADAQIRQVGARRAHVGCGREPGPRHVAAPVRRSLAAARRQRERDRPGPRAGSAWRQPRPSRLRRTRSASAAPAASRPPLPGRRPPAIPHE